MRPLLLHRRGFLAAALLFSRPGRAQEGSDFAGFLESLRAPSSEVGVSPAIFDSTVSSLTLDPSLTGKRAAQGEFVRPLHSYVDDAASNGRAEKGRGMLAKHAAPLHQIAQSYGVPAEMILSLWGMESDFGGARGDRDIFRSLATLAYRNRDNPVYAQEFVAGLVLLQKGLPREKLRGSWAGAMGNPQFMPSAYIKYAKSFSGGAAPDIWANVPDSLASIANFLRQSGWKPGLPPFVEARVPPNFDYATLEQDFAAWTHAGFFALDGAALPGHGGAMLFFPMGANGPAFLLSDNFFVLKAYNFSDSYAFAGATLAEKIAGRPVLRESWPRETDPLTQSEREKIQRGLTKAGLYEGKIDGRFGPVTRLAIHAFQRKAGMAKADGAPSRAVLNALEGN
jgi:membrane-bound lytic murein transglycosylase B